MFSIHCPSSTCDHRGPHGDPSSMRRARAFSGVDCGGGFDSCDDNDFSSIKVSGERTKMGQHGLDHDSNDTDHSIK